MAALAEYRRPPLYAMQEAALFGPERFAAIEGSTKSGKTVGCLAWLLEEAARLGKGNYSWIAPIIEQAKIPFNNLLGRASDMSIPRRVIQRFVETPYPMVVLKNGAALRFGSADKPDSIYGHANKAVVLDEASRCSEEAWNAAYSTMTHTKGRARLIGNVHGRGWFYKLCRAAEAGQRPEWTYSRLTWRDAVEAGVLDQAIIDQARADMPAHRFRELYECTAADDGTSPYGYETIEQATRHAFSQQPAAAFGVDLAKSVDWTVVTGLDESGRITHLERWQKAPWEVTVNRIAAIAVRTPTLVDSTGVGDPIVERLAKIGPNFTGFLFTERSRAQLIEGQAAALQHWQAYLTDAEPHGRQLIAEMEAMQIVTVSGKPKYRVPDGTHDDCLFSHALAVRKLTRPMRTFFVA